MPTSVGYGASFGNNFGGGGLIYLVGLNPLPNTQIVGNAPIQFTVGVQGGLIDLSSIQVTVAGEFAFDGSVPAFTPQYSSSTYHYDGNNNGYSFSISRTGGYVVPTVTVSVTARTTDGATTTQTYSVIAFQSVQYPPAPVGTALISMSVSSFSGEYDSGLLADADGLLFISPSLFVPNPSVSVDVDDVEVRTRASDHYDVPAVGNSRPFLLGPPFAAPPVGSPAFPPVVSSNYLPVFNDPGFTFLKTTGATIVGVLHDTILSKDTVILY